MILLIALLLTPQGAVTQAYRFDTMHQCERALLIADEHLRTVGMPFATVCVTARKDNA